MAFPPSKKSGPRANDLNRSWEAGDSIPAADALHRDGESAWALWTEVSRQHEAKFAKTAPMGMAPAQLSPDERGWAATQPAGAAGAPLPKGRREAQALYTLDSAMLMARRNNRVCPRPARWNELTSLLPVRRTLRGTQPPPAPPTGAAWTVTPSLTKRLCFREQVEWAEREGALDMVMTFMQSMSEDEWLHMGED